MVNNTAIAIVILNNGNLIVSFMFSGLRTKQARYSSWVVHWGSPWSGGQCFVHHLAVVFA